MRLWWHPLLPCPLRESWPPMHRAVPVRRNAHRDICVQSACEAVSYYRFTFLVMPDNTRRKRARQVIYSSSDGDDARVERPAVRQNVARPSEQVSSPCSAPNGFGFGREVRNTPSRLLQYRFCRAVPGLNISNLSVVDTQQRDFVEHAQQRQPRGQAPGESTVDRLPHPSRTPRLPQRLNARSSPVARTLITRSKSRFRRAAHQPGAVGNFRLPAAQRAWFCFWTGKSGSACQFPAWIDERRCPRPSGRATRPLTGGVGAVAIVDLDGKLRGRSGLPCPEAAAAGTLCCRKPEIPNCTCLVPCEAEARFGSRDQRSCDGR